MDKRSVLAVWSMFLVCGLLPGVFSAPNNFRMIKYLRLSKDCQPIYVVVDHHQYVEMRSSEYKTDTGPHTAVAGTSCMAYFVTRKRDQGLCVRMLGGTIIYSDHAKIEFLTGAYGPDKIIRRNSKREAKWCTPQRLLAVRVSTTANESNVDRDFSYAFEVENVTVDLIPNEYFMDSFTQCGVEHELSSGQEVTVQAERDPRVTSDVPTTCELTFHTTSDDEFEQICVELNADDFAAVRKDARVGRGKEKTAAGKLKNMGVIKSLTMKGLNSRFYSTDEAVRGVIVCSENKRLTIHVNRNATDYATFTATVRSQRHVHWEEESKEEAELYGLYVVKGITYFIATIDSLVAVLAALLSAFLKRPRGPWKRWAENFNVNAAAHAPQTYSSQDAGTYTPNAHRDGSYPELPVEMPPPCNEVLVEAHSY